MKVVVNDTKKTFEPITLTLTIESEDELCGLWHRFNIAIGPFEKLSGDGVRGPSRDTTYTVWDTIDELCIARKLRRR